MPVLFADGDFLLAGALLGDSFSESTDGLVSLPSAGNDVTDEFLRDLASLRALPLAED